jgi:hypothetical protein
MGLVPVTIDPLPSFLLLWPSIDPRSSSPMIMEHCPIKLDIIDRHHLTPSVDQAMIISNRASIFLSRIALVSGLSGTTKI